MHVYSEKNIVSFVVNFRFSVDKFYVRFKMFRNCICLINWSYDG
jgi:hypothetical protein